MEAMMTFPPKPQFGPDYRIRCFHCSQLAPVELSDAGWWLCDVQGNLCDDTIAVCPRLDCQREAVGCGATPAIDGLDDGMPTWRD